MDRPNLLRILFHCNDYAASVDTVDRQMTNRTDQQRCDGLVAARILREYHLDRGRHGGRVFYYIPGQIPRRSSLNAELTVSNPRVAMECLKRWPAGFGYYKGHEEFAEGKWVVVEFDATVTHIIAMDESLERAIVDAYLESLK